jgi:tRNA G10  N-methylase Trm11
MFGSPNAILEASGAFVTALGGIYTTVKHLSHKSKEKKQKYREEILERAKEEAQKIEKSLENKIKNIEIELAAQKLSVSKDLSNFKEMHNAEVKVLGEKIESLRQDLMQQHQALVGLLTKLVNSR